VSWLELEGAVNVRDVGGLPTVDGRRTRPGVLIRADNLQDLTTGDVALLVEQVGLRTVVDLRSHGEAHLAGPTPLEATAVRTRRFSLIPEWDGTAKDSTAADRVDVERAVQQAILDDDEVSEMVEQALPTLSDFSARAERRRDPTDLAEHYVGYVVQAGANLGSALQVLADPDSGPTLVHCAAGKDRTGVVVALALSLVGVTRDAVVADYLRSAERADLILQRLQATEAYGPSLADVPVADITPRAASMEGFLDWVDREYGGPHGLAMSLGLDEEAVARLGVRLVGTSPLAR
jgi:protein-tyrosine phosphatase